MGIGFFLGRYNQKTSPEKRREYRSTKRRSIERDNEKKLGRGNCGETSDGQRKRYLQSFFDRNLLNSDLLPTRLFAKEGR